jgi:hypothetical protein
MAAPMDEAAHELAQACATAREMTAPLDDAVMGYKRQLIEQGWGVTAAQTMAVEFHRLVFAIMRNSMC